MLHDSQLPKFLWGEATKHAIYLKNCTWTHALGVMIAVMGLIIVLTGCRSGDEVRE